MTRRKTKNILGSNLNSTHPTITEGARAYQKNKAEKALKKAKKVENFNLNSGRKWVLLPDGKTKVLR